MAVSIKTAEEIAILREGGKRLGRILQELVARVSPGVSTLEIDRIAEGLMFDCGGESSFKGYRGTREERPYPASICASVNDEVVHAPPGKKKILREGDIVGLDIGMWWPTQREIGNWKLEIGKKDRIVSSRHQPRITNHQPLCTDTAVTVGVGKISKEAERLLKVTQEALDIGIAAARPGATTGDIGAAVEIYLKKHNLGIVRELAGHGVGYAVHEEPMIPNYGKPGTGVKLQEGMVVAIEPMAMLGAERLIHDEKNWTYRTADGSLAAHFEHTLALTPKGAEVLTLRGIS